MLPIEEGATGAAVEDVQRRLGALGLPVDGDAAGAFGPATRAQLRLFQQQRRLLADGIVGSDTWSALIDAGHDLGDRLLYVTRPQQRGDDVRALQRSLSRLGFDTLSTDGIFGPDTEAALRDFQHNAGLVVDGIAGSKTVVMLNSLWRRHQAATSFEVVERADPVAGPGSLVGQRILIDPLTRGGPTRVTAGMLDEDAVCFDIARRVAGQLTALGAHPVLSRGPGAAPRGLAETGRASMANELEVVAIIAIGCGHVGQPNARGVSASYFGDGTVISQRGARLAELCVDEIAELTGTPSCRAHPSTASLLRESRAPAAIVDVGFISHAGEGADLAKPGYRHTVAVALTRAIRAWSSAPVAVDAA